MDEKREARGEKKEVGSEKVIYGLWALMQEKKDTDNTK